MACGQSLAVYNFAPGQLLKGSQKSEKNRLHITVKKVKKNSPKQPQWEWEERMYFLF